MSLVLTYNGGRFGVMACDGLVGHTGADGRRVALPVTEKKYRVLRQDAVVGGSSSVDGLFDDRVFDLLQNLLALFPGATFAWIVRAVPEAIDFCFRTHPTLGKEARCGFTLLGFDADLGLTRMFSWVFDGGKLVNHFEGGRDDGVVVSGWIEGEAGLAGKLSDRIKGGERTPERVTNILLETSVELAGRYPTAIGGPMFFHCVNGRPRTAGDGDPRLVAATHGFQAIKSDFDIADNKVITASLINDAVTAAKRVDGVVAQDVPDNRLWNAAFIGTAGQRALGSGQGDGSPTAPTGYGGWGTFQGANENDGYTGNGEYNLHNHATLPHGIEQDNEWSMVGNPGEECVLTVEVKLMTATTPSHDFRVSIFPWDGTAEGTPNEANFAGSNFNNSTYKQVVSKTTLPNMANMTKYRIRLRNLSTGNTASDGYRVRRAMLSRSIDIPRWTPNTGRDRASQQVTGGGGGGGGGGTGGGSGCEGGCVL